MKLYESKDLPISEYHSDKFPQASGSILGCIHASCPAEWKYGEPKESSSMALGVAGHVCLLEPELFKTKHIRGLHEEDHPDALFTGKDLESWFRDSGRKGYSGKRKDELIQMILDTGERPKIWDVMVNEYAFNAEISSLNVVPAKVFDKVTDMRTVIFQNGYGDLLADGKTEVSIIDEENNLKCRPDFIGRWNGKAVIVDYKTTGNVHPEFFGNQASPARMNYWLKMALQHDMVFDHFGEAPRVILLAQSTRKPYVAQAYEMTQEQIAEGRDQYLAAKRLYDRCLQANAWPAYGGGIIPLQTPGYLANQYGFEDTIEIIQE